MPDCKCLFSDSESSTSGALPTFHPEFGRYMLEATPGKPWGIDFKDLLKVEKDMKWRRTLAKGHLAPNEDPLTITTFPRLGTEDDFTVPYYPPSGPALRSQFVPDEIANPHIRFPTLAANIRSRRGRKVELNVPIFKDKKTPSPFNDPTIKYDLDIYPEDADVRNGAAKVDHVYMDAMAFGMGSCCLQITFQAKSITEGRILYDQLSPLGPIMLALTANTPIYKGFLVDTDVRWNQISRAVDDRTAEELGETPLKNNRWRIPKSRYASNSTYIAQDSRLRPEYMDPNLVVDEKIKQKLIAGGMDDLLATHFAHLFIRDPLVIFAEDLKRLDPEGSNHFENIQSTNWQHMRFKPPPPDADIGWRVEFRSMEIQFTDFENAAFAIFIVLITRVILSFDLNFYIPIARTTENMETAHTRDAVLNSKFWFRKDPFSPPKQNSDHSSHASQDGNDQPSDAIPPSSSLGGSSTLADSNRTHHDTTLPRVSSEYELMTICEIINGPNPISTTSSAATSTPNFQAQAQRAPSVIQTSPPPFPGLIPLVESYLNSVNIDVTTRCFLARYLDLIRLRAAGTLWTGAKWQREFVRRHPDYKFDSEVGVGVTYDLLKAVQEMGGAAPEAPEINGEGVGLNGNLDRTNRVGWEMLTAADRARGIDD